MATRQRTEYEVGLKDDTRRGADSIRRSLEGIGQVASAAASGLAAVGASAAVASLAGAARAAVDLGDQLRDLSKSTGASVEQLGFLNFAADQSGTSVEQIGTGIARLAKNLNDVAKGGGKQAAAALEALGLSATELARGDAVSQLTAIGTALDKVKNPTERLALAQQLLGKSAKELLPLLLEGGEGVSGLADRFVQLNASISTDQANTFDALNDSVSEAKAAFVGLGAVVAEAVAPTLTAAFKAIADFTSNVAPFFQSAVQGVSLGFAKVAEFAARFNLSFAETLQSTLGSLPGFDFSPQIERAKQQLKLAGDVIGNELDAIEAKEADRARRAETLRKSLGGASGAFGDIGTSDGGEAQKKAQRAAEALEKAEANAVRQLELRLVAENDVTEAARVRYEIESGAYAEFSEAGKEKLRQLSQELDLQKESAEVSEYLKGVERERRQEAEQAMRARDDERQRTIEALRTPQERYVDEVNRLISLNLGSDNLARGIAKARDEMIDAQDKTSKLNDVAQQLGLTFSSAFEDAIIAGKSFSSILEGIAQDIARLFIRKSITEPLVGILGNAFSGGFSGLFNSGGGGGFSNAAALDFGGFRASGGSVSSGRAYVVGERGPELFVPGASGAVMNVSSGDPVVNIYNQTPSDVSARRGADGRSIEVFVTSALERNVSRGGSRLGLKPPIATR